RRSSVRSVAGQEVGAEAARYWVFEFLHHTVRVCAPYRTTQADLSPGRLSRPSSRPVIRRAVELEDGLWSSSARAVIDQGERALVREAVDASRWLQGDELQIARDADENGVAWDVAVEATAAIAWHHEREHDQRREVEAECAERRHRRPLTARS